MSRRGAATQIAAMAAIPDELRCHALVRFDINGSTVEHRRCRRRAQAGGYCNLPSHRDSAAVPRVDSSDGGWCIWCGQPAKRYTCSRAKRGGHHRLRKMRARSSSRVAASAHDHQEENGMTHSGSVSCDVPAHTDHERELRRAAEKIQQLEARNVVLTNALADIVHAPCDANGQILANACACCMHDRMIARAALDGLK